MEERQDVMEIIRRNRMSSDNRLGPQENGMQGTFPLYLASSFSVFPIKTLLRMHTHTHVYIHKHTYIL